MSHTVLDDLSSDDLLRALERRGLVVSAWSIEDLEFLDDDRRFDHLDDEGLTALKLNALERTGGGLKDELASRGNEYLLLQIDRLAEDLLASLTSADKSADAAGSAPRVRGGA